MLDSCCISIGLVFIKDRPVSSFWVLRFRDLGASCFGLRFRVLRFRNYQKNVHPGEGRHEGLLCSYTRFHKISLAQIFFGCTVLCETKPKQSETRPTVFFLGTAPLAPPPPASKRKKPTRYCEEGSLRCSKRFDHRSHFTRF